MKRISPTALGLATALLVSSGYAIAQDQPQTTQLVEGNAQLDSSLNSKSAKQGDVVTAKLTSTVKTSQGVELPRGTKLLGHIDQVAASDAKSPSKLVLTFDKAQLKNGKELTIKATIAGITPVNGATEVPHEVSSKASFEEPPGEIAGVSLRSAVEDGNSGTLTGEHRDISLLRGTQLLIVVAPQLSSSTAEGAQ
jgi:hypothetical protein